MGPSRRSWDGLPDDGLWRACGAALVSPLGRNGQWCSDSGRRCRTIRAAASVDGCHDPLWLAGTDHRVWGPDGNCHHSELDVDGGAKSEASGPQETKPGKSRSPKPRRCSGDLSTVSCLWRGGHRPFAFYAAARGRGPTSTQPARLAAASSSITFMPASLSFRQGM